MKYVDEFRDPLRAQKLLAAIAAELQPQREYRLMEFCGGHTHAIHRFGIPALLPENIRLIHGPGCPVCVLPMNRLDQALELAQRSGVILCSYGDMLRVPGSPDNHRANTLLRARAQGADVRMVYSTTDALKIAADNPQREVVFFAIGFETTTPPTAVALREARRLQLNNFSVFCNHVLTPPALRAILQEERRHDGPRLDGIIGPAHVSTVIGSAPYEPVANEFNVPIVIAGFEPLDVLHSILLLLRQIHAGEARVETQFTRAVTATGNQKAQALMSRVFVVRDEFEWRGLGMLPNSALAIHPEYRHWDAEARFQLAWQPWQDHKACECGAVLRGAIEPAQCKIFGTACTPDTPIGPCMVSSEGACAAHFLYGPHTNKVVRDKTGSRPHAFAGAGISPG